MEAMAIEREFWRDRRVLLTGHTGFKGAWLALWLHTLGARVTALALDPATRPALYPGLRLGSEIDDRRGDIRDAALVADVVRVAQPEVVFHLAAQALVRLSYREPVTTYATNVMGTVNLLEALRGCMTTRAVVVVTSDKCYANDGSGRPCRETDPLGGHDPYSSSKAATEMVAASYRDSFFATRGVRLATVRAGNVIGGGDWSEDRLIPDAVRAWSQGLPLRLRNPNATRPWQHVLAPISGCLRLAESLWHDAAYATAWNFGPTDGAVAPVGEVIARAAAAWGGDARWETDPGPHPHEAPLLALDSTRAVTTLGYGSRWSLAESIVATLHWYRRQLAGADMRALTLEQIHAYAVP